MHKTKNRKRCLWKAVKSIEVSQGTSGMDRKLVVCWGGGAGRRYGYVLGSTVWTCCSQDSCIGPESVYSRPCIYIVGGMWVIVREKLESMEAEGVTCMGMGMLPSNWTLVELIIFLNLLWKWNWHCFLYLAIQIVSGAIETREYQRHLALRHQHGYRATKNMPSVGWWNGVPQLRIEQTLAVCYLIQFHVWEAWCVQR